MSKVISHNKYVICKKKSDKSEQTYGSFVVDFEDALPIYEIEYTSNGVEQYFIGDCIITNSIPTKFEYDGQIKYSIAEQNIIGKVL